MKTTRGDRSFLGRGWSFPPEFSRQSRQVKMVSQEEDIRQSLVILFSTSPGERIMQPAYGCGLNAMVFENLNESTATEIKDIIERAVLFFEPRIILNRVELNDSEIYNGLLKIQLEYTIRSTNSRSNMVYPFYFREGTHIRTQA
jgi:phage baseplate assembly protein W